MPYDGEIAASATEIHKDASNTFIVAAPWFSVLIDALWHWIFLPS